MTQWVKWVFTFLLFIFWVCNTQPRFKVEFLPAHERCRFQLQIPTTAPRFPIPQLPSSTLEISNIFQIITPLPPFAFQFPFV